MFLFAVAECKKVVPCVRGPFSAAETLVLQHKGPVREFFSVSYDGTELPPRRPSEDSASRQNAGLFLTNCSFCKSVTL